MKPLSAALLLAAALCPGLAVAQAAPAAAIAPDAAKGATTFKTRCGICHSVTGADTPMAPPLNGVINRKAALGSKTFKYSDALKNSGKTWNAKSLDAFITAPQKDVPGTKMVIAVPNAQDRANIIAYLTTVK